MFKAASKTERLFFALWPDDEVRERIIEVCNQLPALQGQRLVEPGNIHLTLHFLGNIPLQRIDCFLKQAARVKASPFALQIVHSGYFKKARVLWLGCRHQPAELVNLHKQSGKMIRTCGYQPEQRPYHPHITCARKVTHAIPGIAFKPIHWPVSRFVLVQSNSLPDGVEYKVKASFALDDPLRS